MHLDKQISLDPKVLLSPTINFLGKLLGDVIIEQAGKEFFDLEEKIRLLSKSFRENNDYLAVKDLQNEISNLTPKQQIIIIRSFSLFFQLVNLAEENFRIKINNLQDEAEHDTREDTSRYSVRYAKENGISYNDLLNLFTDINLQLVWTAHPTEARRLTNLLKIREIYSLLTKMENEITNSLNWSLLRDRIKGQITLLWQSDDLREDKVEIIDEVRSNLFYFENTVFDVLPKLMKNLELIVMDEYGIDSVEIPKFIDFASWVGGDRDGHPFVTASITIQTLLIQKRLCLRKYKQKIAKLLRELSSSLNLISISSELKESLDKDIVLLPEFANRTSRLNRHEPYRRKLDFIRIKLDNTLNQVEKIAVEVGLGHTLVGFKEIKQTSKIDFYNRSKDFLDDLMTIDQSLRENNGKIIASGDLSTLITQVKTFGFHLAPLDLRQDSEVHIETLDDIFHCIGLPSIKTQSFEERKIVLLSELKNPRPLGISSIRDKLKDMTIEVISTLEVAKEALEKISPRSIGTYIISMTRDESDIYSLMLLMKEAGLITISQGIVTEACLDIAPLFETKNDLENAPLIMERLFRNPVYKSLLAQRGDIQEIMIGYSDSTKDSGVLMSNYQLFTAQQNLVKIADNFGINLRIFHGRGGSISRGGGPTHKSILSQPIGTISNMKITEQGEVIGSNYSNPEIAYRHLEQIMSAIITRSIRDSKLKVKDNPANPSLKYLEYYRVLADYSSKKYQKLVKQNEEFIPFYLQFTPLDLIERATIGSRPSRRTSKGVKNISSLRAIPWIFSWMQSRFLLPGFYGVGTSLNKFVNQFSIEKLNEMYQNWPYFDSLINNLQMVSLKADMEIASQYLHLVKDQEKGKQIFDNIREEFELTKKMIIKVTKQENLLDNSPHVQTSIIRRNPYIDPLNLIQVELLKQWRKLGRPEDLSPIGLQRALLQTINGIAAGLRNTG